MATLLKVLNNLADIKSAGVLHFASELRELPFFGRFGGETSRVCSGFPSLKADDIARQVLDLHRRHGQAILDVLNAAVKCNSEELVKRSVPTSSVLMMTVGHMTMPALSNVAKHPDRVRALIEIDTETAFSDVKGVDSDATRTMPATVAHETTAIKALGARLKANSDLTRAAAEEWCRKSGHKLGKRAFERVWPQAREAAGLARIGSPGRKRKPTC